MIGKWLSNKKMGGGKGGRVLFIKIGPSSAQTTYFSIFQKGSPMALIHLAFGIRILISSLGIHWMPKISKFPNQNFDAGLYSCH